MITQIKKDLPTARKVDILEKLLIEACEDNDIITVDYIGLLSDTFPHIADISIHRLSLTSTTVVVIEPRCYKNIFKRIVEHLHLFVIGLIDIKNPMYGNLRINGKKIEY